MIYRKRQAHKKRTHPKQYMKENPPPRICKTEMHVTGIIQTSKDEDGSYRLGTVSDRSHWGFKPVYVATTSHFSHPRPIRRTV